MLFPISQSLRGFGPNFFGEKKNITANFKNTTQCFIVHWFSGYLHSDCIFFDTMRWNACCSLAQTALQPLKRRQFWALRLADVVKTTCWGSKRAAEGKREDLGDFEHGTASTWSRWLEATELKDKKRCVNECEELDLWPCPTLEEQMHLLSSLASCLPDLIKRPVIVYCHSACEHQYGLIQVYDLKMRRAAVGFITQLHERRIIWDSLIKQLSEQKGKKKWR